MNYEAFYILRKIGPQSLPSYDDNVIHSSHTSGQSPQFQVTYSSAYVTGDGRASEQPALTAIHTLFMREHNRLVDGLHVVNPHWDDELLYQHGRRILTAVSQHITYNEFLPRILGWNAINLYELKLRPQGYYKGKHTES